MCGYDFPVCLVVHFPCPLSTLTSDPRCSGGWQLRQLSACEERAKRKEAAALQARAELQTRVGEVERESAVVTRKLGGQLKAHREQLQEFQAFAKV